MPQSWVHRHYISDVIEHLELAARTWGQLRVLSSQGWSKDSKNGS